MSRNVIHIKKLLRKAFFETIFSREKGGGYYPDLPTPTPFGVDLPLLGGVENCQFGVVS